MTLPQIPFEAYRDRAERARSLMDDLGLDAILATPSTNFRYLTGCSVLPSDRFLALLFRKETLPAVIAPILDRDRIATSPLRADVLTWRDGEDPFSVVRQIIGNAPGISIGLEPRTDFGVYVQLVRSVPEAHWVDGGELFEKLRLKKSEHEIACMEAAVRITEEVFKLVPSRLQPGITERELGTFLCAELASRSGEAVRAVVQFGESAAIPSGAPGGRALSPGDLVLIDLGTTVCGYHSDLARVLAFRQAGRREQEIYEAVWRAQDEATIAVRPGIRAGDIDKAARAVIQRYEYGHCFLHRIGHGIGLDLHEAPRLLPEGEQLIEPGMVFAIEPGIYIPGKLGVRTENAVLVTEDGHRELSVVPRELIVVE
jgi:Xaa-Pro dipeptidase